MLYHIIYVLLTRDSKGEQKGKEGRKGEAGKESVN